MRSIAMLAVALFGCRAEPQQAVPAASVAVSEPPRCAPPNVLFAPPAEGPADATLVMLHGYGANAADIEPVARALAAGQPRLAVLVPDGCDPLASTPGGRQWWALRLGPDDQRGAKLRAAATRIERFVGEELARRGLPRDRVVWAGFSQGAIVSQWMAVHASPRPVAVVSLSGRFDDDEPPGARVGVPVLLVHGGRDAVIPFAESERAERALVARGALVERVDRPSMAHGIDGESRALAVAFLARNLAAR